MTPVLSERPPPPPQSWSLCSRADAWQRIWKTAKITVVVAATTAILQFHRDQPGMEYAYFIGPIKLCKKKKETYLEFSFIQEKVVLPMLFQMQKGHLSAPSGLPKEYTENALQTVRTINSAHRNALSVT